MNTNPNTNAAGLGGALGILIVWLLGRYGISVSAEGAAAISTVSAAFVLYVGRDGLGGMFRILWRGSKKEEKP